MSGDKLDEAKTAHIDKALGKRLLEFRETMGLKRHHVAAALDVSVSRIQQYEGGARVPASRLWQFCARYGIAVGDLFEGLPHHVGPNVPPLEVAVESSVRDRVDPVRHGGLDWGELDQSAPFEVDATAVAIGAAVLQLNPVERSVILAAVRGVGIKKLKTP